MCCKSLRRNCQANDIEPWKDMAQTPGLINSYVHINGLMQKRLNNIALSMELCLFCIKPIIWCLLKMAWWPHWYRSSLNTIVIWEMVRAFIKTILSENDEGYGLHNWVLKPVNCFEISKSLLTTIWRPCWQNYNKILKQYDFCLLVQFHSFQTSLKVIIKHPSAYWI